MIRVSQEEDSWISLGSPCVGWLLSGPPALAAMAAPWLQHDSVEASNCKPPVGLLRPPPGEWSVDLSAPLPGTSRVLLPRGGVMGDVGIYHVGYWY